MASSSAPLLDGPLRNHSIVFLGDSTLRYLYLTLINLGHAPSADVAAAWLHCRERCFWNEHSWPSWSEYYSGTSLSDGRHRNLCDCYRGQGWPTDMMENRYNAIGGTSMAYLQMLNARGPIRGTWWPGDPDELRMPHSSWAPRWELQFEVLCRTLLPQLQPSVIVVNVGHHVPLHERSDAGVLDQLYARVASALHNVTQNIVWVTSIANHQVHGSWMHLEHGLIRRHFHHILNTSKVISQLGAEHFFDGHIHMHAHGNILVACRLLAMLHGHLIKATGARHACPTLAPEGVAHAE